jgi:hypothetical protein
LEAATARVVASMVAAKITAASKKCEIVGSAFFVFRFFMMALFDLVSLR